MTSHPQSTSTAPKPKRNVNLQMDKLTASIEKVPKPDDEYYKKQDQELSAQSRVLHKELNAIQRMIRDCASEDTYSEQLRSLRRLNTDLSNEFRTLMDERKAIHDDINFKQEDNKMKKTKMSKMKKDLEFESVEDIDEKLNSLEKMLISTSIPIADERNLVQRMQQLERMKPKIRETTYMEQNLRQCDMSQIQPLKERLNDINSKLKTIREKKKENADVIQNLSNNQESQLRRELYDKKQEVMSQLEEQRVKADELHAQREEEERRFNLYMQQIRDARNAQAEESRKINNLENQKRKMEQDLRDMDFEEHTNYDTISNLVKYIERLNNDYLRPDAVVDANSAQPTDTSHSEELAKSMGLSPSEVIVMSKKETTSEYFIAPIKAAKNKKTRRQGRKGILTHDMMTMSKFNEVNVPLPMMQKELKSCLDQLTEKLEAAEEERRFWLMNKESKIRDLQKKLEEITTDLEACKGKKVDE